MAASNSGFFLAELRITKFSRFRRAQGSLLPHRLTGRQAPLKRSAPRVRFERRRENGTLCAI